VGVGKKGSKTAPAPADKRLAELQERNRQARALRLIDGGYGLARTLFRTAGWVAVAAFAYLCIGAIAGKETKFEATAKAMLDLSVDRWAAYGLAAICGAGYYNERRLRRKTIKDNGEYIRRLEEKIDPKRSKSGLSATGKPKKEDLDAP
jgi:hypothetical protein